MKYSEALQYKKEALEKADESVRQSYHIIITPAALKVQNTLKIFQKNLMNLRTTAVKNTLPTTNMKS